jgi:CarD family transcriptional regulator, regulator of rRNA transcription
MSTTQFSVGEKVVYPNHGVGIIEQISSRTIGTSVERFYLLRIRSSSLKVMVPFHNAEAVGLRRIVQRSEAQQILDYLADGKCEGNSDWKNRFKENSDKMRTGSLLDVAIVLKGLLIQAAAKPLSFREKKMLERARFLLVTEMAMARANGHGSDSDNEEAAEEELRKALAKCKLRWPEASSIEA